MQGGKLRRGVGAQFVGEGFLGPRVHGQCVGGASGAGEGTHQQAGEPFVQRMFGDERLQLGDEVASWLQVGFDPVAGGGEPQLGQPGDRRLGERGGRGVGERGPPPERECLAQDAAVVTGSVASVARPRAASRSKQCTSTSSASSTSR